MQGAHLSILKTYIMETKVLNPGVIANQLSADEKNSIEVLVKEAILQMGSAQAVANKCGVSPATISQIEKGQYKTQGDEMWRKIGAKLSWNKGGWVIVSDVTNTRIVMQTLTNAQEQSMFMGISERAGSGKSTGIKQYLNENRAGNVFYLECWVWREREFLNRLRAVIGMPQPKGDFTVNEILEQVIHYFLVRKGKPLLIIDQANSLPHSTLCMLIHIYNKLKDKLGCVIVGTENLQQKIERGIKNKIMGYDELSDRICRLFVKLHGYSANDVKKICSANGITDKETINKVWLESTPVAIDVMVDGEIKKQNIVESGRVIERKIIKYKMLAEANEQPLKAKAS